MSEETSVDMEVGEVNTSALGVAWFFTSKGEELHLIYCIYYLCSFERDNNYDMNIASNLIFIHSP